MEKADSLRSMGVEANGQGRVPFASSWRGVETSAVPRAAHACLARQPRGLVKKPLIGPVSPRSVYFFDLAGIDSRTASEWRRAVSPHGRWRARRSAPSAA